MAAPDGIGTTSVSSEEDRMVCECLRESRMGENKTVLYSVGAIVAIILALAVILVPLSFSGVEYYEFGFRRRKTTGSVDTGKVYTAGLHAIGPDYEFKKFDADAHFEQLRTITVFTADRLQVTLSCSFQFFLRKDELPLLHKKYDIHYLPILRSNALDALKGAATQFATREFIRERNKVENALFNSVQERLGGVCCRPGCTRQGLESRKQLGMICRDGCIAKDRCTEENQGLHADVRYFQLTAVDIPDELNQRYLQALILQEDTETEKLKQVAKIIRKETEGKVEQIENEAREISQNGTALSELIMSKADANSRSIVENARSEGLQHLYHRLGIRDAKHKTSLDYLRSLRGKEGVYFAVGYDTLVAGPMGKFFSENRR